MASLQNRQSSFPHIYHQHMQTLLRCFSICSSCAKMCIEEGRSETAALCSDCADICALAIKLHSGDSEFSEQAFELCARACDRCAEECEEEDSEHCHECGEICRKCAEACRI